MVKHIEIPDTTKLIQKSLKSFGLRRFEEILGETRLRQYAQNNFDVGLVYGFMTETLEGRRMQGIFNCILGYEFNVYLIDLLKSLGATNVQEEVCVGSTRVDALAQLDGKIPFKVIQPDDETVRQCLPSGYHTFEAKATKVLQQKCVTQIRKAKGQYKNVHVFVLSDTSVGSMNSQVRQAGGDVIRADIGRAEVVKRILNIKKKVKGEVT